MDTVHHDQRHGPGWKANVALLLAVLAVGVLPALGASRRAETANGARQVSSSAYIDFRIVIPERVPLGSRELPLSLSLPEDHSSDHRPNDATRTTVIHDKRLSRYPIHRIEQRSSDRAVVTYVSL
ncbi:hypothetical protein [Montanilutibacter psychrotolerans]|uniref:Uncharacterized protein n=1 Tax=Montanilutibacter psychrotolerans TaxID=1327343 RepID=A0A3M8STJ0_9GAMM|nr:hypothetical protein [Lysobacter psychrotolerans]RNF82072.1 hypothetical protein EER27_15605 [Lysobacter psychrotolerans]